jgi:deleted-in-malignant-brain-tumors protein 1
LANGASAREGRVEIFYSDRWGSVCQNNFDILDARVVCRQLGYSTDNVQVYRNAAFGEWGGKIWLDEVECQGSEVRLEYCPYYGMAHNCHHNEEVGVACREFGAVSSSSSSKPS